MNRYIDPAKLSLEVLLTLRMLTRQQHKAYEGNAEKQAEILEDIKELDKAIEAKAKEAGAKSC